MPTSPRPSPPSVGGEGDTLDRTRIRRRTFLGRTLASLATVSAASLRLPAEPSRPARLRRVTIAEAFDAEISTFMASRRVPGGALAIVKEGRILYARGYGWADRERRIPVAPDSLFRIASISKPVTAAAVLRLAEQGRLDLGAKALSFINLPPHLDEDPDERLHQITVRHLLQHTGGWDREQSFDPMFRPIRIAEKVGAPAPASASAVIRYMLGRRLDFDPGTRYAYSNFGYCLLGRIIETITGQTYEQFVRDQILSPLGISQMRLGATLEGRRRDGEVRYYMASGPEADSVFPAQPGKIPWPYGGFHLEAMDAHGGWIASAIDLVRFTAVLDPSPEYALLNRETLRALAERPAPPVSRKPDGSLEDFYYGCGWMIRPVTGTGQANYWHAGSLPGTATLLVRRWDGLGWAALFNQRSESRELPDSAMDGALHRAAAAVTDWTQNDCR